LEFAGDSTAAHLLTEDGVGLVIVDGSGLAAGLPLCQSPELAGEVEAGDRAVRHVALFSHSVLFVFWCKFTTYAGDKT